MVPARPDDAFIDKLVEQLDVTIYGKHVQTARLNLRLNLDGDEPSWNQFFQELLEVVQEVEMTRDMQSYQRQGYHSGRDVSFAGAVGLLQPPPADMSQPRLEHALPAVAPRATAQATRRTARPAAEPPRRPLGNIAAVNGSARSPGAPLDASRPCLACGDLTHNRQEHAADEARYGEIFLCQHCTHAVCHHGPLCPNAPAGAAGVQLAAAPRKLLEREVRGSGPGVQMVAQLNATRARANGRPLRHQPVHFRPPTAAAATCQPVSTDVPSYAAVVARPPPAASATRGDVSDEDVAAAIRGLAAVNVTGHCAMPVPTAPGTAFTFSPLSDSCVDALLERSHSYQDLWHAASTIQRSCRIYCKRSGQRREEYASMCDTAIPIAAKQMLESRITPPTSPKSSSPPRFASDDAYFAHVNRHDGTEWSDYAEHTKPMRAGSAPTWQNAGHPRLPNSPTDERIVAFADEQAAPSVAASIHARHLVCTAAVTTLQRAARPYIARCTADRQWADMVQTTARDRAAVLLQRIARGYLQRRSVERIWSAQRNRTAGRLLTATRARELGFGSRARSPPFHHGVAVKRQHSHTTQSPPATAAPRAQSYQTAMEHAEALAESMRSPRIKSSRRTETLSGAAGNARRLLLGLSFPAGAHGMLLDAASPNLAMYYVFVIAALALATVATVALGAKMRKCRRPSDVPLAMTHVRQGEPIAMFASPTWMPLQECQMYDKLRGPILHNWYMRARDTTLMCADLGAFTRNRIKWGTSLPLWMRFPAPPHGESPTLTLRRFKPARVNADQPLFVAARDLQPGDPLTVDLSDLNTPIEYLPMHYDVDLTDDVVAPPQPPAHPHTTVVGVGVSRRRAQQAARQVRGFRAYQNVRHPPFCTTTSICPWLPAPPLLTGAYLAPVRWRRCSTAEPTGYLQNASIVMCCAIVTGVLALRVRWVTVRGLLDAALTLICLLVAYVACTDAMCVDAGTHASLSRGLLSTMCLCAVVTFAGIKVVNVRNRRRMSLLHHLHPSRSREHAAPRACVAMPSDGLLSHEVTCTRAIVAASAHVNDSRHMRTVYVDSMALRFISSTRACLVRVTCERPDVRVDTVSGSINVDVIGVAGLNMQDRQGNWHHIELPEAHVCSQSVVELYPVQLAFAVLRIRHFFDDVNELRLPDGSRVPFASDRSGYPLKIIYGMPLPDASLHRVQPNAPILAAASLPRNLETTWRRLGYPYNAQWLLCPSALKGIFPTDLKRPPNVDRFMDRSVLKGRMRALPLFNEPHADNEHKPGEKVYLDGCGPVLPAIISKATDYIGCVDAASGYATLYACHAQSEPNAVTALAAHIADLRSLIRSQTYLSPLVVRTDGGGAFIARNFQEFCTRNQSRLTLSAPHTPQQNSLIERVWGTRFATARVLLSSANLSARFHEHALRTANWLHNRLPSPSRDGSSPYLILTGSKPDMTFIRTFGCAVAVFRDAEHRTKMKGHKKLTADHAVFGVYMGPSELYPAHVVYLPSTNKLVTSAHCDFDESAMPGSPSHAATDWGLAFVNAFPKSALSASDSKPPLLPPPVVDQFTSAHGTTQTTTVNRHLDGQYWQPNPAIMGVDNRLKRATPARTGTLQRAYAALTGSRTTPTALPAHLAPLMSPNPVAAYECIVGYNAQATLPLPDIDADQCLVPKGYMQAMKSEHASYWRDAIDVEWNGIMANDTLDFVKRKTMPHGSNLMNSHFVFDVKPLPDGSIEKFKARLVADGNTQRHGVDFDQIFATVVKMSTLRIVLALAATHDWGLWQLDVRQAFIQADVDEELYMRVPPHLPSTDADGDQLVCKLKKSLYGLKQAARTWASALRDTLLQFGFMQCTVDTCVYKFTRQDGAILLLCVYVDDLICAYSTQEVLRQFLEYITSVLPIDDRGELLWVLRMQISRERSQNTLIISQQHYVERVLQRYLPEGAPTRGCTSPMDETKTLTMEQSPALGSPEHETMNDRRATYMSAIGSLLWLAACTRPDIAYTVSTLARYCSNPGQAHYDALLHLLGYIYYTRDYVLRYVPDTSYGLVVYSDASWETKFSTSGGLISYNGCAVAWWSRRQKSVSASTAEAECHAAALASREAIYVRDLLADLGYQVTAPTPLYLDNKAALDLSADPVAFKKTKHILRHAFELRDRVARRLLNPIFVPSDDQLADVLTKGLRPHQHVSALSRILFSTNST